MEMEIEKEIKLEMKLEMKLEIEKEIEMDGGIAWRMNDGWMEMEMDANAVFVCSVIN
jgi:hypothetical protein